MPHLGVTVGGFNRAASEAAGLGASATAFFTISADSDAVDTTAVATIASSMTLTTCIDPGHSWGDIVCLFPAYQRHSSASNGALSRRSPERRVSCEGHGASPPAHCLRQHGPPLQLLQTRLRHWVARSVAAPLPLPLLRLPRRLAVEEQRLHAALQQLPASSMHNTCSKQAPA